MDKEIKIILLVITIIVSVVPIGLTLVFGPNQLDMSFFGISLPVIIYASGPYRIPKSVLDKMDIRIKEKRKRDQRKKRLRHEKVNKKE